MKIYVFPADEHGCGHYRLIWPARELTALGHDVEVVSAKERDRLMQASMRGDVMVDIRVPEDADVLVFQRVTHRYIVQAISLIRRKGIAVVVDMDDDLTCIHPANPAFGMLHPRHGTFPDHTWKNTLAACEAATYVTVSTPALLDTYVKHGRGQVLYNYVPQRMLDVPRVDNDTYGWAGSVHSHPNDLQTLGSSVAQLIQQGRAFRVVGPIQGIHSVVGLPITVPIAHTGSIRDINLWPDAVATLGVGIAPLADTKFNTAKSWLKMAEYAASGVPCVGSPRAEYARLYKLGVGQLAKNPNDWRTKIMKLTSEPNLRDDLGRRGREVMRGLTIEGNAWRWLEGWQRALEIQREHALPFAKHA